MLLSLCKSKLKSQNQGKYSMDEKLLSLNLYPASQFLPSVIQIWSSFANIRTFDLGDALLLADLNPGFRKPYAHISATEPRENLIQEALKISLALHLPLTFSFPDSVIHSETSNYRFIEEPDEFEYIYDIKELAEIKGRKFNKQRNSIAKLKKEEASFEIYFENLSESNRLEEIRELCQINLELKSGDDSLKISGLQNEMKAFEKCLSLKNDLNLKLLTVYRDGVCSGFLIFEEYAEKWLIGHFFKCHPGFGIYIIHELCKAYENKGFKYFNFQEDRGIKSLRFFKQQLNPAFYIKSFKAEVQ